LKDYTKGEEDHVESIIKQIADSGVNVVIAGQSITEISKHYLEKYKIMIVRIMSKFELKRLAKAINARILTRLGAPTAEEMGYCSKIEVEEVGS